MVGLSLVVLRCADLAVTKRFYEALGSPFSSSIPSGSMPREAFDSAS
jgi:hypothetical protein